MEKYINHLASYLRNGFYAISGYDFPPANISSLTTRKRAYHPARLNQRMQRRPKSHTFRWFHALNKYHVAVILIIAFSFPAEMGKRPFFHFVCPIIGWLAFYSIDAMVARIQSNSTDNDKASSLTGLCSLLGYNLPSRLILMLALIVTLLCTFTIHLCFHLASGFIFRWLVESQFRFLVNFSTEKTMPRRGVGFYKYDVTRA